MTDAPAWQPPTNSGATPPPASPFAPAATPGAEPAGGMPSPAGTPGWTPPPRPGLIPLRPLTFGTLLGAAFQVLRRNPRPTFGFALLITGGVVILTLLTVGLVTVFAVSRAANATGADAEALSAGSIALLILSGLVSVGFSLVGSAILQGIISLEVARGTLGEKLSLGMLMRAARGRLGALIGWSLLVAAGILVAILVVVGLIAALTALGGTAGIVIGVLLGLVAGGAAAVLAFWLGTRLSLVPSVLMLERLPLRAALARSWSLTRGYFWKTLGIQLLVNAIVSIAGQIVTAPLSVVMGLAGGLVNPNSDTTAAMTTVIITYGVTLVVTVVIGAIGAVVQSATPALIYIDLRMRKEGLDLELSRFVEARQSGDATVADPYLPRPAEPVSPTGTTSPWS